MSEEHIDRAVRAAERIVNFLGITKENGIHATIANIIVDETGLPEITAERDMLKRQLEVNAIVEDGTVAERDKLREALDKIANFAGEDDVVTINTIVGIAQAALAKAEPVEGKK